MAKARFFYICALLGCFGFYIAYREWLSWLLFVGLLGLPWLSLFISLPLMLRFRADAQGPSSAPMGTAAAVTLRGKARFLTPPYRGRIRLLRHTTGETWVLRQEGSIPTEHCGGILAVPERVYVYDLLGLFRFRVRACGSATVLVRPNMLPMGQLPELDRFLARSWRPKPGGGFGENHEMRLYRPGDNLNQVHWKLTAKTGKLTIREPQEPDRGLVLLTLDICGTGQELDRKFGRLLWLGDTLLNKNISFEIRALTGEGILSQQVTCQEALQQAVDRLLCCAPAPQGSILDRDTAASWHRHIGGDAHEV